MNTTRAKKVGLGGVVIMIMAFLSVSPQPASASPCGLTETGNTIFGGKHYWTNCSTGPEMVRITTRDRTGEAPIGKHQTDKCLPVGTTYLEGLSSPDPTRAIVKADRVGGC